MGQLVSRKYLVPFVLITRLFFGALGLFMPAHIAVSWVMMSNAASENQSYAYTLKIH